MGCQAGPVGILLLQLLLRGCCGGRVLMYLPVATRSHLVAWYPLAGALALSGHEVTFVTGYPSTDLPASVDQLAVDNSLFHEFQESFTQAMLQNPGIWSVLLSIPDGWDAVLQTHRRALSHPRLKKILNKSNSESWDLVIASPFLNEAGVMLADYLRAPMILYLPANAGEFLSLSLGHPDSLAWSGASAGSLKGRINNLLINLVYSQFIKPYYFVQPQNLELTRHIPNYTVATYKDLERNADFAFYFASPHLGNLAPRLPNTANTAFIHCRKGKPLKPEIESWINRSPANQSIVYMSMGSLVKFDHVPSKTVDIFEKVFEKLNLRVIWKRSGTTSDRIFMTDWIDQQDILAHPRVNIFISLVGLMSIQESIYHEVPLLGIPLSFEQKMNADLIEKNNLGIVLDFDDITEDSFTSALVKLQHKHHKYQTHISELASRIKDTRTTPLQDAVWWCEYVMRNKGGDQLLSDYRHLSLVKFYCLDIILIVMVVVAVLLVQILFSAKVLYVSLKYLISLRPFARICQFLFCPGEGKQTKKNV